MGQAADTLSVLSAEHAERESTKFEYPLIDYIRLISSVKSALAKRQEKRITYSTCVNDLERCASEASEPWGYTRNICEPASETS